MNKYYQKIFALMLAVAMIFAQTSLVFADDGQTVVVWQAESGDIIETQQELQQPEQQEESEEPEEEIEEPEEEEPEEDEPVIVYENDSGDIEEDEICDCGLSPDDDNHDKDCEFFFCECGQDTNGKIQHQPGCEAYVMSEQLREICNLVSALPEPADITAGDEQLLPYIDEITEKYYALSAFDVTIFDHSEYMIKLLEVNQALYSAVPIPEVEEEEELEEEAVIEKQQQEEAITTYVQLQFALDSGANGEVIKLADAFPEDSLDTPISFDRAGVSLTIDLNEKTIAANGFSALSITNGTICLDGYGVVSANYSDGGAVNISNAGVLKINNAEVINTNEGGCAVSADFTRPESYVAEYSDSFDKANAVAATNYTFSTEHNYIKILEKADVSNALVMTMQGWGYSETEKTPTVIYDGETDVTDKVTLSYSTEQDGEYLTHDEFLSANRSSSGNLKAGNYFVKATYINAEYGHFAEAVSAFSVSKKQVFVTKGTLTAESKIYGASSDAVISGEAVIDGAVDIDDVQLSLGQAHFASDNAAEQVEIVFPEMALVGTDNVNYQLLDNKILDLYGKIEKADGILNPDYLLSLEQINAMQIISNLTPTLKDVELPAGWSFSAIGSTKTVASADSDTVGYDLKYHSSNSNYSDVTLVAHPIKTSTVSLNLGDTVAQRQIEKGKTAQITSAEIAVKGAPLQAFGRGSYADMIWRCDNNNIVSIQSGVISKDNCSVSIKANGGGIALIELAYDGSAQAIGSFIVEVTGDAEIRNDTDELIEMAQSLSKKETLSTAEVETTYAIADAVRELSDRAKSALKLEDIQMLDKLFQKANNRALIAGSSLVVDSGSVKPVGATVYGIALSSGVTSGSAEVKITAEKVSGNVEMLLSLEMLVNGNKTQLTTPLFFEITLPDGIDMSKLTLRHIKDDGSSSRVSFEYSGQTALFSLNSFSKIEFMRSVTGSGSGSHRSGISAVEKEEQFWDEVEAKILAAKEGDVIIIDADDLDKIPVVTFDLIKQEKVTLIIDYADGKTLMINGQTVDITAESNRVYYPFDMLADLLAKATTRPQYDVIMQQPVNDGYTAVEQKEPAETQEKPLDNEKNEDVSSEEPLQQQATQPEMEVEVQTVEPPTEQLNRNAVYIVAACVLTVLAIAVILLIVIVKNKKIEY